MPPYISIYHSTAEVPDRTRIKLVVITPPPVGERSIVMSVSVCVCLSVRDHIFGTTRPIFTNFLCVLPMAVARSCSGGVVIICVLPVLWMTSCCS